jgi:4'-phosphopantetheinyl transferase
LALYAVTSKSIVGIDNEYIREDIDTEQIAQKFFSQNEIKFLENAPEAKRKKIFYQLWTRKEAILKAMGKGISFPMDQFDVSLINEQDFSPVGIHGENRPLSKLYVQDIELDEGYFAAIAYESCGMNISFWNYIH